MADVMSTTELTQAENPTTIPAVLRRRCGMAPGDVQALIDRVMSIWPVDLTGVFQLPEDYDTGDRGGGARVGGGAGAVAASGDAAREQAQAADADESVQPESDVAAVGAREVGCGGDGCVRVAARVGGRGDPGAVVGAESGAGGGVEYQRARTLRRAGAPRTADVLPGTSDAGMIHISIWVPGREWCGMAVRD